MGWKYVAKKDDDDLDRVRPPHKGNDERRIGREKSFLETQNLKLTTDLKKKLISTTLIFQFQFSLKSLIGHSTYI